MEEIALSPVVEADHVRGPADAPVTLIEYADFQCPYCSEAHAVVQSLERRFARRLRFVFRQFPLREIHEHAEAAAEAAEAAGAQGRFWEMHDLLFAHARALGAAELERYARDAGVPDLQRFASELSDHHYAATIDAALERGASSGVEGTPTFFINGRPFEDDPTLEALGAAIEAAVA